MSDRKAYLLSFFAFKEDFYAKDKTAIIIFHRNYRIYYGIRYDAVQHRACIFFQAVLRKSLRLKL